MVDKKQLEQDIIDIKSQKSKNDKMLFRCTIALAIVAVCALLSLCMIAAYADVATWLRIVLITIGFVICLTIVFIVIAMERIIGYHECKKCHHRYVPTYKQVVLSPHLGFTRYLKCPKCGEKTWSKKVIGEE